MIQVHKETQEYQAKGKRPFRLVVKPHDYEFGVFRVFADDSEPQEELLVQHHLRGCALCFDLRQAALNKVHKVVDNPAQV